MKRLRRIALWTGVVASLATPLLARDPSGSYHRKNGDLVRVWITNGSLYCRIIEGTKPNFEMCNGMRLSGEDWAGKKMKHPAMPGFMRFNGTVSGDETSIKIKGCAFGKSFCDSELWTKVK